MCKRLFSCLLCLLLLLSMATPVLAKEKEEQPEAVRVSIASLAQFLTFAKNCRLDSYSQNMIVSLDTDLDLTTASRFEGIPIFCGIFEGNGHTIRGLELTKEGSEQGLFRFLTETAEVRNLNLSAVIQPGGSGSTVGGLVGSNSGKIRNCTFTGTVSGTEEIGGLAGVNTVSGIIENCRMSGIVYGDHFVGGIAGSNRGVIRNCENEAEVNVTVQQNSVSLQDITLDSLTNSESSNTVTDIGGIAGNSIGVIRDCVNKGTVGYRQMGYNIGGIAGTQSGYVTGCTNYGDIFGRKEVGGIVGQMEPSAKIEYKEDVLQILQRQLAGMGSTINETASNVEAGGQALYWQVLALSNQLENAKDGVQELLKDNNGKVPDKDTLTAGWNNISGSISGMGRTLQSMNATTQSVVGTLSNNLYSLQAQMNAMQVTLGNASETLGGSVKDVSDQDKPENLTGKVEKCTNFGSVSGDMNVGGITGAIAPENDLDTGEDIEVIGSNSLNFQSELRAVVLSCSNEAQITLNKQNGGGIVGLQTLGLVKQSYNSGPVSGGKATHVGGISGLSTGFIRACGAKCTIQAAETAGGIAGSATILSESLSLVQISGASEKTGAILGIREDDLKTDEEIPVRGNLYVAAAQDYGGIDGISYSGLAQPVSLEALMKIEGLPELFSKVTLRFVYENGGESRISLTTGSALEADRIPAIPKKPGYTGRWKELEEADLSCILFDMEFHAEYVSANGVLESTMARGKRPLMLLQGNVTSNSELILEELEDMPALQNNEQVLECWSFEISEAAAVQKIRFCLPEAAETGHTLLKIRGADDSWREMQWKLDGSYAVFEPKDGDNAIAVIRTQGTNWILYGAGGIVLLAGAILLYRRRKR